MRCTFYEMCFVVFALLSWPHHSILCPSLANLSDGIWSEGSVQDKPRCLRCTSKQACYLQSDSETFGMTLLLVSGSSFHSLWVAIHAAGGKSIIFLLWFFPVFSPRVDWHMMTFFYLETTYTCQFMLNALTEIWRKEQFLRSPFGGGKIVKQCYLTFSNPLPSFPFSQVP